MTKRLPVSAPKNRFYDSQNISNTDLTLEQNYNNTITSAIINNHIGTGIVPEVLEQNILFDSSIFVGYLDGVAVSAQAQPSDNNLGNQLEISLSNSMAAGHRTVKLAVIGLDFQGNLQFEIFYFKQNETQIGKKHFTNILLLMFNDLLGDPAFSMNLGGTLVIREAKSLTLSRDPVILAQDVEPNLFFRDFFIDGITSLNSFLQSALPNYNIDTLGIYTAEKDNKILAKNDVSTQIGQKFQATTNNIQKITLLLSVQNLDTPSDLTWNGEIVMSIYELQSNIECPSDLAPNLDIDFSPFNVPLAQLSDGYTSLAARGIVLDSVPQPVDFIFSNSPVAGGNVLIPGNYYAFSLKRSGAANKSDILIASGLDRVPNSRITTFTGTLWVDIPEQDLWFKIFTDAAKVSDGKAYDTGNGIEIDKTTIDPTSQATIDYSFGGLQFTGNDVYRAQLEAITDTFAPEPDESTGNPVDAEQQFVPQVTMLNSIDFTNVEAISEPLLLGSIVDKNRKFDASSQSIQSYLYSSTIANNEIVIKLIDDTTDPRYNSAVNTLASNLLNGDFVNAKIFPNNNNNSYYYRIAEASLCSMLLGDVNGDGRIDEEDLDLLRSYIGTNLNLGMVLHTNITTDGYHVDGYTGYLTQNKDFTNLTGAHFQIIDGYGNVLAPTNGSQYLDGILLVDSQDGSQAQFSSLSVTFNNIVGLANAKVAIFAAGNDADYGAFQILSVDADTNVLTIKKIRLSSETYEQMLRADINNDMYISIGDGYLLESYIERLSSVPIPSPIYAAPSTNPYNKIGKAFDVLRLKVEKYIDRNDDYTALGSGRGSQIHFPQDIFSTDGYFQAGHNFLTNPSIIVINKQLTWEEDLIIVNSDHVKQLPVVFSDSTGFEENNCATTGVQCNTYEDKPDFDPGKINSYIPNDLIIGNSGQIKVSNGDFWKGDLEIYTVILEIPNTVAVEKHINLVTAFVTHDHNGLTFNGFTAPKFADCSYADVNVLVNNQVKFGVAVQSYAPQLDGLSSDGYLGIIVSEKIGVALDQTTGILSLNFANLYEDPVYSTLTTKIEVTIYLKKAGFNNQSLFVNSTQVSNMLNLI